MINKAEFFGCYWYRMVWELETSPDLYNFEASWKHFQEYFEKNRIADPEIMRIYYLLTRGT